MELNRDQNSYFSICLSSIQHHLLKRFSLLPWIVLVPLSKINYTQVYCALLMFLYSMCLLLCQATLYRLLEVYNKSWNQVAGVLQPCSLPWLLWISGCFTFHLHFRNSLSICLKIIKIFDWHYIESILCSFWVYCLINIGRVSWLVRVAEIADYEFIYIPL